MARQTRAQRRARREAQAATPGAPLPAAAGGPPALPPRQIAKRGDDDARRRGDDDLHRQRRGFPGKRFVSESWGELKKVEWPGQTQVIQGTVVVLIACIIVGFYLYVNDLAWKRVVNDIFLR